MDENHFFGCEIKNEKKIAGMAEIVERLKSLVEDEGKSLLAHG